MKEKACKQCGRITYSEICKVCKAPTSSEWMGYASIIDPENSLIAKKLNINSKGKFALKVK
jgi:DNA-directed RNA polymerase subunit E"